MATLAEVFVAVRPQTDKFDGDLRKKLKSVNAEAAGKDVGDRAGKGIMGGFKSALGGLGGVVAGAFAGVAVGAFLKDSVKAATEMGTVVNKTNVIFGANAATIQDWAKTSATAFGLSRSEALASAAQLGDMFKQLGFTADEATKTSKSTVQLAADLGSFNKIPTADVLERINAAFRGEYDSLQKLIPNISDARIKTEALAATGKTSADALTAQEKATAVLAIVQKDGALAAGNFAKSSDSLATKQVVLAAKFADVKRQLGEVLLPVISNVVTFLADHGIPAFQAFIEGLQFKGEGQEGLNGTMQTIGETVRVVSDVIAAATGFIKDHSDAFTTLAVAVGAGVVAYKAFTVAVAIASLISTVSAALRGMTVAQIALNVAMVANPIGLVIAALVALGAGLVVAYKKSETFRDVVNGAFNAVKQVAMSAFYDFVIPALKALMNTAFSVGEGVAKAGAVIARALGQDELAGKLDRAGAAMRVFKDTANKALNGILDKRVMIDVVGSQDMGSLPQFKAENARGRATGGPVFGAGTGTSDSIPARLSNNEHVWTAREVRAAGGHGAVEAMRRSVVRGFATGGAVGPDLRGPSDADFDLIRVRAQKHVDTIADRLAAALNVTNGGGPMGNAGGGGGFRWQMSVLQKAFPGLRMISGFRPGAITATGNPSYHGKGRAVDLPPRRDVFNWIRSTFGAATKELIFSPAGGSQIRNGQPHVYSGVTKAMHQDHVHWAYDGGGVARGRGFLPKATIAPERVLSSRQTATYDKSLPVLERLVALMESGRGPGGGLAVAGDVYAYDPREVAREMDRRQSQRDALAASW